MHLSENESKKQLIVSNANMYCTDLQGTVSENEEYTM